MTITITPRNPTHHIGPGLIVHIATSLFGPFPSSTLWTVQITSEGGTSGDTRFLQKTFPVGNFDLALNMDDTWGGNAEVQKNPDENNMTTVAVTIQESGGGPADDSAVVTLPWSNQIGLPAFIQHQATTSSGGLTTDQAAQLENASVNSDTALSNWNTYTSVTLPSLQDVLNSIVAGVTSTITGVGGAVSATLGQIFSGKLLDLLTTFSVSGGVTCDPIDADLSGGMFYGVIVKCDTIPDFYAFTSPGDSWCPRDLAVLTITRGGAILLREGVHTRSHMVYPLPGVPAVTMEIDVPFEPPSYHVTVDWGEGVCGELLAMELP